MGSIVGENSFIIFEFRLKCGYIHSFVNMHHMLSEMRLVKYDTKIIVPIFNAQMPIIPEHVERFLLKSDLGKNLFVNAPVRED